MRQYKILVTGVGAIIGYGLINSLRKSKYNTYIVGMDIYDDAYGKCICDEFIQAIPAADELYPKFLKNIIKEKDIDLVMFGTEQEIHRLINEQDKKAVENAASAANRNSLSFLPILGEGEALIVGVDFPMPLTIKIDVPQKAPDSQTPKLKKKQ